MQQISNEIGEKHQLVAPINTLIAQNSNNDTTLTDEERRDIFTGELNQGNGIGLLGTGGGEMLGEMAKKLAETYIDPLSPRTSTQDQSQSSMQLNEVAPLPVTLRALGEKLGLAELAEFEGVTTIEKLKQLNHEEMKALDITPATCRKLRRHFMSLEPKRSTYNTQLYAPVILEGAMEVHYINVLDNVFAALDNSQDTFKSVIGINNIHKLSDVVLINVHKKALARSLPLYWSNLANLRILALAQNVLSGPIPSSLGDLKNLTGLSLADNELTGEIPHTLGNLTHLTLLQLSRNKLTGDIPDSLGNLLKLSELYLDHNELSGKIPKSFENLVELKVFRFMDQTPASANGTPSTSPKPGRVRGGFTRYSAPPSANSSGSGISLKNSIIIQQSSSGGGGGGPSPSKLKG